MATALPARALAALPAQATPPAAAPLTIPTPLCGLKWVYSLKSSLVPGPSALSGYLSLSSPVPCSHCPIWSSLHFIKNLLTYLVVSPGSCNGRSEMM